MKAIQKTMIPVQQIAPNQFYIHFNIETKTDADGNSYQEADEVTVTDPNNRDEVIMAIVRYKYSENEVEAIILNYIIGLKIDEMNQLQQCRLLAKAVADGIIKI